MPSWREASFTLKLLFGGIVCTLVAIPCAIMGFTKSPDGKYEFVQGMWLGPILFVSGIILSTLAIRNMLRD